MSGSFDFSEFEALGRRVNEALNSEQKAAFMRVVLQKAGLEVVAGAKSGSPVDTGTLRRAWRATSVEQMGSDFIVTISNNTEYASFVENGHRTRGGGRWVEGKFMLRMAVEEARGSLPQMATKEFEEFIKGIVGD